MVDVVATSDFNTWLRKLKDNQARLRILERVDRLAQGNPGDVKPVGSGISELRLTYGPGYRVYPEDFTAGWSETRCVTRKSAPDLGG